MTTEMYARGLSTRDIEDMFTDENGKTIISKDVVSKVSEELWEEYQRFISEDLSSCDIIYLFVDAVYESLRLDGGTKEGLLCSWGIQYDGKKVLLHLELGNKESYESWRSFFRGMIKRGFRCSLLIISDGAPGLIKAIEECFPIVKRQRCLAHKLRNISNKLLEYMKNEVMAEIKGSYYQANKELAI